MLYVDFLDKGIERFPDNVVLRDAHRSWTYREIGRLVDRIASALMGAGLVPGAKVAIYSPNHAHAFACQYGALRAGCVWVPLNFRNTAEATLESLNHLGIDWLFFHSSLAKHLVTLPGAVPTLKGFVALDDENESPVGMGLRDWIDGFPARTDFPLRRSGDIAAILSSSGTTGKPKGIELPNRAFATMVAQYNIVFPWRDPQIHLVVAPLSHAAGMFVTTFLAQGGTNVLLDKADPLAIMEAIERYRVNAIFLPPTVIYMMLAHPRVREFDYSSLRTILYGSAPISADKLREALDVFGPVLAQTYGQSEALMMLAFMSQAEHVEAINNPALIHRLKAAGREGPLMRVAIMDDAGHILPPDTRGEIVIRGDILLDRYYADEKATAEAAAYGWHHTGDIGFKDADGYVYLVDRKKDIIISGGFNIFPGEVEQAVLAHPAVQDCAVVGIPDPKWGEAVHAAIELKAGAVFREAEFIAFCKERLGSMKAPKSISIEERLPRSTVGKVLRREIRARYWAGRDRAI
ncbi:MAG TPA: AMP-binding protein [Hypericibacter adhaerens]|uniref:O-succinylbenzoate--CoA ligase n=1 Tax=Hypericibacter adhaerens TaxID=2602016 RepID=A0A5J6MSJ8_9PROT|nr:AMP-binding protein [Hypericibacter adhaerens]QEX20344.1 o-succinylbenzoate--CoA ligase [Hypericibacter adhaerens]HWA46602.1 AMP-binding protein [Hypericibacter adhaerens]